MTLADDRFAVIETLDRYAVALDTRDWSLLDRVFTPDASADYGDYRCASRDKIRKLVQSMLGGCGPTQHLLGVYRIEITGDEAKSTCSIRAHHVGRGAEAQLAVRVLRRVPRPSSCARPRAGASASARCASRTRPARARS